MAIKHLSRLGRLNLIFFLVTIAAFPCLALIFHLILFQAIWVRLSSFWAAVAVASLFLMAADADKPQNRQKGWGTSLAVSSLSSACLYLVLSYLPEITNYPFTLTWSEASRYYYASLYFSERIYGVHATPTVLHPSRYLLQAIPFLIPSSSILLHRAWQVLLWILLPTIVGYVLARRLQITSSLQSWLLIGFVVLFLMVGPVYYHLLVPVVLVLAGFQTAQAPGTWLFSKNRLGTRRFFISVLVVLAASAWAGISRVNWYPVPGCLAAVLILLEEPIYSSVKPANQSYKSIWIYLLRLAGWVIFGTGIAFVSQMGYILWSGNSAERFTTSFTSDLLWHRLLPNNTYPPGLVLAIAIVSLPLIIMVFSRLFVSQPGQPTWREYHFLRLLGLAGILLVFFTGGMVVSVKIGGGSNLHNLDAFMTFLLLISAYFYYGRVAADAAHPAANTLAEAAHPVDPETSFDEHPVSKSGQGLLLRQLLGCFLSANIGLGLALFVSASSTIITRTPVFSFPDPQETAENLNELATPIHKALQNGGEVLFIGNRQLLTFRYFDLPLVADYERVFLMEAAMANDEIYLDRFHQELAEKKFALIISEPLSTSLKKPKDDFGAENNAWVNNVSRYILCYYTPIKTLRTIQMQILTPASQPKKGCP